MANTYFISDHHFGHSSIIDFEARPFADTDEMNATMIAKWNAIVSQRGQSLSSRGFFLLE